MRQELRPISTIRPYDNNPRVISEKAVRAVAESIEKFGWKQPLVVDTDGVIICGHTRYRAGKYLSLDTVPVVVADDLTPEQVRAYRIADNKTAEKSGWNFDLLPDEIAPIESEFDFTKLGFEKDELDKIMGKCIYAREKDPDKIPDDLPPKPITQPGEIVEMGDHRLICGDSTKPETFAALMGSDLADIVITDPPYGVSYTGGPGTPREGIANDSLESEELTEFVKTAFTAAKEVCRPGACFYVWCASAKEREFLNAIHEAGIQYRQHLVWRKSIPNLTWADYLWQHELCVYCNVTGSGVFWNGGRGEKTIFTDDMKNPKDMTEKELRDEVTKYRRIIQTDVITEKMPDKSPLHPTTKPTRLYQRLLMNSSRRGDILLDFFGGSGTAVIAAEETRRRARVIELDPHYCDVIVARWEDYTGRDAVRRPPNA